MQLDPYQADRLRPLIVRYHAEVMARNRLRKLVREVVIEVLDERLDQFLSVRPDLEITK